MKLALLDRDGVIVVNRATNIKCPCDVALIEGASDGIARLNAAGFTVAICTNQPEVGRGVMSQQELDDVHQALVAILKGQGAVVERVYSCVSTKRCPGRKPSPGMLREALRDYGAEACRTPFVGDQVDDLKAGFHAGCRRFLVRTGLGEKEIARGVPDYLQPFVVCADLRETAERIVRGT